VAGFRSALFLLGLSATGTQAGYRNPLPIPPIGGTSTTQAGFIGVIPLVNLGGTEAETPTPEVGSPAPRITIGGSPYYRRIPRDKPAIYEEDQPVPIEYQQLLREDEELLLLIEVFLQCH